MSIKDISSPNIREEETPKATTLRAKALRGGLSHLADTLPGSRGTTSQQIATGSQKNPKIPVNRFLIFVLERPAYLSI